MLREVLLEIAIEPRRIGDVLVEAEYHDGVQLRPQHDGDLLALVDLLLELEDVHVHDDRVYPRRGIERPDRDFARTQIFYGVGEQKVRFVVHGKMGEDDDVGHNGHHGADEQHDARASHEAEVQHRLIVPDLVVLPVIEVVPPGVLALLSGRGLLSFRRGELELETKGQRRRSSSLGEPPTATAAVVTALVGDSVLHIVNRDAPVVSLGLFLLLPPVQEVQPLQAVLDQQDDFGPFATPQHHAGHEHGDIYGYDDNEVPQGALHGCGRSGAGGVRAAIRAAVLRFMRRQLPPMSAFWRKGNFV
ncbi:precorrin 6A synthase, putative [Babesia ovata]|uniref:Precorrin 6A synthase, putative n=1 Tax=Babesia ovata TaxID=189622 RepID=A0A2H6K6Q4_9APIC|nr:precorrin 6A synthase, putative [Babesia ovata]GBE58658.1 precorrin 6A synthase, putative [Babesia ovata]